MAKQHIVAAQKALKDAGFLDKADGFFGKDSLDAVNAAIKKAERESVEPPKPYMTPKMYVLAAQESLKVAGFLGLADGFFGKDSLDAVNAAIKATGFEPVVLPEGYITANFKMAELIHSNTAVARKISNKPNSLHEQHLIDATVNLFQPVREILDAPMVISSGYRSPAVNRAVGGSSTSAHSIGYAIDFKAPNHGDTVKIAQTLVRELYTRKIGFDQIILEFPNTGSTWVHLGYKDGRGNQRRQVLTAKKVGGKTKYLTGLVP